MDVRADAEGIDDGMIGQRDGVDGPAEQPGADERRIEARLDPDAACGEAVSADELFDALEQGRVLRAVMRDTLPPEAGCVASSVAGAATMGVAPRCTVAPGVMSCRERRRDFARAAPC